MEIGWHELEKRVEVLLAEGSRIDAYRELAPLWEVGMREGDPAFLRAGYDTARWLGFVTRRFWIHRRAWSLHPGALWCRTQRIADMLRRWRPVEAWELARRDDRPAPGSAIEAMQFELAQARTHCMLRDFSGAEAAVRRAHESVSESAEIDEVRAWTALERDELDEALALCEAARERWPGASRLREQECYLLLQRRDPTAALQALEQAASAVQCPSLRMMYADALFDAGDHATCIRVLEQTASTMPLERPFDGAVAFQLARAHRCIGDDEAAARALAGAGRHARKWRDRMQEFVASDAAPGTGRVVVPVPYVRQDHVTCSPATMASLLAWFGVEIEQREIAEQITYDGTASHAELNWARQRDLSVWFFQFDEHVARRLVDLGFPFAISTRSEASAHRQALAGYDRALGTFILRDPGTRSLHEVDAERLTKSLTVRGGDCALIVPAGRAADVPVDLLPLHSETTALLELIDAYERRDVAKAERLGGRLLEGPESNVRWEAELRMAHERDDRRAQLELFRRGYEAHPDDAYWQFRYAVELLKQDRWGAFLVHVERHVGSRASHLAVLQADHLRHAATTRAEAERMARRAIRWLPHRARPVRLLADVLWDDVARRGVASELFRFASLLEPHDEGLAETYAEACMHLGRAQVGLDYLHERHHRFGSKHGAPGATLARALERQHRRPEAIETLRAALAVREDPQVRAALFDLLLSDGQHEAASALLGEGDNLWHPIAYQDARRRLAEAVGDHAAAARAVAAAVAVDPNNGELQVRHLRLVMAAEGRAAALATAERVIAGHGEDPRLLATVQRFYDEVENYAAAESLLRRLVAEHPSEHWLRGRLARHLIWAGRIDEARPLLDELLRHRPDSLAVWLDAIDAERGAGDLEAAVRHAEGAARRWAGDSAILLRRRALATSRERSAAAVREAMDSALSEHLPPGEADLDIIVDAGSEDLERADVDEFLSGLSDRFPAQPGIGAARCRWLAEHDPDAAVKAGEELLAAFPWRSELWLLQAGALRQAGRRDDERELLQKLIERQPGLAQAWTELGESLEQEGRSQEAMDAYDRGLERAPQATTLHAMRANLLWSLGCRDEAIEAVDRAALLSTGYAWARRAQVLWRLSCDQDDEALEKAKGCVGDNPNWTFAHLLLAEAQEALGEHDERVQSLRRAVTLDPRLGSARRRLVSALLELRRFAEAEQAIDEGLELLGDDCDLHQQRIHITRTRGEQSAARRQLRELLERRADYEDGWLTLLHWLEEDGLDAQILEIYRDPPKAIVEQPTLPAAASEVYRRRGENGRAAAAMRKALEMAPDYDWARDTLAVLLLDTGEPEAMLGLFPGAEDPTQLPFRRASLVARAAAAARDLERARSFFLRVLLEPYADAAVLLEVEDALIAVDARGHADWMPRLLPAARQRGDFWTTENLLHIQARRGKRGFWAELTRFAEARSGNDGEQPVARLVKSAHFGFSARAIAKFVRRHVAPPIADLEALGCYLFALGEKEGARLAVDLLGGDYRRPGIRGAALANLMAAYSTLEQWEMVEEVGEYALCEVPRDHSFWWHRRYLGEAAYHSGEHARCRELCEMEIEEYPTVKVYTVQFALLAEMATTPGLLGRRRLFGAVLPELLGQAIRADQDSRGGGGAVELAWGRLFGATWSPRALLLASPLGRRVLSRFVRSPSHLSRATHSQRSEDEPYSLTGD